MGLRERREDVPFHQFAAFRQRLSHDVATGQDQHIEHEQMQVRAGRMVLQEVERRFAAWVEGDDFAVNDCFVRERLEGCCNGGIAQGEIVVVARSELNAAASLDGQRSIAVELQFILPGMALRQCLSPQQQHRLDEGGFPLRGGHLRSVAFALTRHDLQESHRHDRNALDVLQAQQVLDARHDMNRLRVRRG